MPAIDNLFSGPIPGQSLTKDPDSRGPWEMPPKFNAVNSAIDHLFQVVTSDDFISAYGHLLSQDKQFYVDEIVAGMLDDGFINGLWTVDTMMLLAEPLTILMVWAAAQMGESVSFSSDTGYEDRTGYEDMMELLMEGMEGTPVGTTEEPEEAALAESASPSTPEEPQQSPLTTNIPQSPLTGGM